ncbi:MAG: MFS transporter, partial [Rhizobiales bacterium]|nr:MFS transporter [Hyphomicrobiales bacterium]
LYSSCAIIVFTTAALAGLMLAPSPGWATAPITTFVIGAAATTIPASLLMQRVGRRPGFILGAAACIVGASLAAVAIFLGNFLLFCLATGLQGVFQAFGGYYRFAAVEASSEKMKPMAISWVLTGGVVAAVAGTLIASGTSDLFGPFTFAGSYAASSVIAIFAVLVLLFLKLPKPTIEETQGERRPWSELLRQPRLIVAIACATLAFGMMNLMMTAAPVAMIGCGFDKTDASWVIQWHVLAMFVPSFFTGHLIVRYGVEKICVAGMLLLIAAGITGLAGITFGHFAVALILLGLGWNFGFIGGTTMLTESYRPAERGKVQAANDFAIAALMVVASLSSGKLLATVGWASVSIALFPMAAVALVMIGWLVIQQRTAASNIR